MKLERSNVDHPLWRKKVDSSIFNYKGTTIPNWACKMWKINQEFKGCNSKKNENSKVTIRFNMNKYDGWVTEAKEKRNLPAYRLWFTEDLLYELKDIYLMSFMRDIEDRLRNGDNINIEEEIPFWEFLDIEYDDKEKTFYFTAYYTQKPSFPELFKRLLGSPIINKIYREIKDKETDKIYKQSWKPKENYVTEIGAENVIYMLIDTQNKLLYIGEAANLIRRFNQGHPRIPNWNYYRYNVLPNSLAKHRVELERMLIRDFAYLLEWNDKSVDIQISKYRLTNEKIDKH